MAGNQSFSQVLGQIGEFLKSLSPMQRLLLSGGAVAVVVTLFVFVRLIGKPDYKPLYQGTDPAEVQAVRAQLKSRNVDYQLSADGRTVSVPADELDRQRLELASASLPRSGRLGFELFDKTNWSGSDFSEKVNYQRALEGELERTIQTLAEVEAVRVHLVLPSESIFADREREAKASVILKLRHRELPAEAQATVARLVAGAVDQLRPENVTVIDADNGRPLVGGVAGGPAASSELEQQLAARLVNTLEPVVGADRIRASVRIEFDQSTTEQSEEKYDPAAPVATVMHKREEETRGATASGVPGTASNVPSAQGNGAGAHVGDATRVSRSEDSSYAVNRTTRRVVQPAGRIKRITAALLVDDAVEQTMANQTLRESRRKRTPEEMKQIEELARAALALDTGRGDVLAVENLSFQQTPAVAPAPPSMETQLRQQLDRWSDVVRYGVIALLFVAVYMVLLRPVKRQVISSFRELPAGLQTPRLAKIEAGGGIVESALPADAIADANPEVQRLSNMKRRIVEKVKAEPAVAARLVQSWLQQEDNEG